MDGETRASRKGGRPRKSIPDRRTLLISARVRPDELAVIEGRAASANRGLSEFVREQLLSGTILVRRFRALSPLDRHDLARIGSNLNQIARVCNTTGHAPLARTIEGLLGELRALLIRIDANRPSSHELGEG